jgi:hypothetical protein
MPTFEEMLKAALSGYEANNRAADLDLHHQVAEAAKAVEAISDGRASLSLVRQKETENHTVYSLVLTNEQIHSQQELMAFRVSARGYPIDVAPGAELLLKGPSSEAEQVNDRDQLETLFADLASNPDSSLVVTLAYILRRG